MPRRGIHRTHRDRPGYESGCGSRPGCICIGRIVRGGSISRDIHSGNFSRDIRRVSVRGGSFSRDIRRVSSVKAAEYDNSISPYG